MRKITIKNEQQCMETDHKEHCCIEDEMVTSKPSGPDDVINPIPRPPAVP
jgi:hypothetical protein